MSTGWKKPLSVHQAWITIGDGTAFVVVVTGDVGEGPVGRCRRERW